MRVLVTGGAGFIGSHLVRRLVERGYSVRVLDNFSTGSIENIRDLLGSVELVRGDVRDPETIRRGVEGVEAVVHLAALISVPESVEKPDLYFDVNVKGTYNISKAFRGRVLVFASSSSVYGEPQHLPVSEGHPLNPKSPYAASKIAGEAFTLSFSHINGYRPVVLRIFNAYGPGQSRAYAGVVSEFVSRVSVGEPPVIYGDGEQTRDFIHVSDVVEAVISAVEREEARGVYNIGSGREVKIRELARIILEASGRGDLTPIHAPPREGDVRRSCADISRAVRDLGWKPKIRLEDGIRELVEHARKKGRL